MFAHVQLGAHDIERMTAFYDRVLAEFGLRRMNDLERIGAAGVIWRRPGTRWPKFVVNAPYDGGPATSANGSQVSFLAPSRNAVDTAWRAAMEMGARDLGQLGIRQRYASDFYAAYCRDPEGHKICFVHTGD